MTTGLFLLRVLNCSIKPVYFIQIPFEARLDFITNAYGSHEKEKLVNAIIRIQKRLGPMETKIAIGFLLENNYKECFKILLCYYDKYYLKGLNSRENIEDLFRKAAENYPLNTDTANWEAVAGRLNTSPSLPPATGKNRGREPRARGAASS